MPAHAFRDFHAPLELLSRGSMLEKVSSKSKGEHSTTMVVCKAGYKIKTRRFRRAYLGKSIPNGEGIILGIRCAHLKTGWN